MYWRTGHPSSMDDDSRFWDKMYRFFTIRSELDIPERDSEQSEEYIF